MQAAAWPAGHQSMLRFNADGTVINLEYSADVARVQLCRLIARLDLPLCFGESEAFEEYIKTAHNPRHVNVSRQTTTRHIKKYFKEQHAKLAERLKSVSCVALTSDIWSGNAKEDYLSVVAHFVNSDWKLEKMILAMRLIDCSHSGSNIAERISTMLGEYGLTDKVFSITLDNASSNTTAMDTLKLLLSGYVGPLLMHQRCGCHIINLFVKSTFDVLNPYLDDFRTAISFLNSSNQRIAAYKSFCIAMSVRPRKFGLDMDVRWNSTYLMLKHLIPYKSTFDVFIQTHYPQREEGALLTNDHWYVGEKILEFLERFYDSTVVSSASTNAGIAGTELSSYLDSDIAQKFDDDFDILDWWRDHKITYPILSILAKDIFSVPVSTVSSESAFSLVSRVIKERRRRLAPSMVEMLSLVKD
ncbi:hypothetical protein U9M48_002185 [Paspalum notatum var. saurae]|uniref:HAT C-terminal dimerisation domain-containing protein n=1 Tax=Paspalum notatum var. saurae TaxID=547442 RepID=A0AAQ3PQU7_PASNO